MNCGFDFNVECYLFYTKIEVKKIEMRKNKNLFLYGVGVKTRNANYEF